MSRLRIIGVGNPLMGDDGVGPAVIERLMNYPVPAGVELVDAGTIGFGLLHLFEGVERVILVDAVEMGRLPGDRHFWRVEELLEQPVAGSEPLAAHQAGLLEVLELARMMELLPQILELHGIQPGRVERYSGLSPAVERGVRDLVAALSAKWETS